MTGVTKSVIICEKIKPPTMTRPSGRRAEASWPNPRASGTAPIRAASVVIMMGRKRSRLALNRLSQTQPLVDSLQRKLDHKESVLHYHAEQKKQTNDAIQRQA